MASPRERFTETGKGKYEIAGEVCENQLGFDAEKGEHLPPRRYISIDLTYDQALLICNPVPYDPTTGKGSQREEIRSHVNKLRREMRAGHFTPTPWAATLKPSHFKNMVEDEKRGIVTISVNETNKLPLIDANHRRIAMQELREEYESAGFVDAAQMVGESRVTMIIHLHPEYENVDFRRLQEGKGVDKSQLALMREQDKDIDPKKYPVVHLTRLIVGALDADPKSPLYRQVAWMKNQQYAGRRVQYAVISNMGASDIAHKVGGGAKALVQYPPFRALLPKPQAEFEKAATTFARDCYVGAYEAIQNWGSKTTIPIPNTDGTNTFPNLFGLGKILTPISLNGSLGGTSLMIMLGNMLMARTLLLRQQPEIDERDLKLLVKAAEKTLDLPSKGKGATTIIRELTAEFAREYFDDVIIKSDADEHKPNRFPAVEGVPLVLTQIWSTSTFAIDKHAVRMATVAAEEQPEPGDRIAREPVDATEDFLKAEAEDEFSPPTPDKPRRNRRGAVQVA